MAITVRPYVEHLGLVRRHLDAILADKEFNDSARARMLVLEGPDDYSTVFATPDDATYASAYVALTNGTLIGEVLDAGGFKRFFRDQPIDETTLAEIVAALSEQYSDYAPTEGLRFRSSSSVEDIEGFNGAGLYDSNTGFLAPEAQPDDADQSKSIESAILKTWSSYWGFEAFEERRLEGIDHLSGAMAVTVHARSDDELETNNGVATYAVLPPGGDVVARLTVNVQPGATSVTNPEPGAGDLPEVVEVERSTGGEVLVKRISSSSLQPDDEVLSDNAARELFAQTESVAEVWQKRVGDALSPEQRATTLTLDFEFKTVAEGWPVLQPGRRPFPARLVLKQVRSLDPGPRDLPSTVRALPVPRDVLARARLVERSICRFSDGSTQTTINVFTNPVVAPDVGYSVFPFVANVTTDPAAVPPATGCTSTPLYSTPEQYLTTLLANRT